MALTSNFVQMGILSDSRSLPSFKLAHWSDEYLVAFGRLCSASTSTKLSEKDSVNSKWCISVEISALLDDPSVLIEGVLFRARYLGSTQLVCEGQPTKSTRMCQAEEAVSRIKVCVYRYMH